MFNFIKKKKLLFLFEPLLTFLIFIPYFLFKITSPTLISNSGGSFTTNTIIMDFSIGELKAQTLQNNEILTQGFLSRSIKNRYYNK